MNSALDLARLLKALPDTTHQGDWVVILCPSPESAREAATSVSVLLGDAPWSGRTAQLPWGKLSVAAVRDPIFVPEEATLYLTYYGWAGESGPGLAQWQKRSAGMAKTA